MSVGGATLPLLRAARGRSVGLGRYAGLARARDDAVIVTVVTCDSGNFAKLVCKTTNGGRIEDYRQLEDNHSS